MADREAEQACAGAPRWTPGPWVSIIDDSGGPKSGWPLCITSDADPDHVVVRTGGQWPYEWDRQTSQAEACANARLIAAAPELVIALQAAVVLADAYAKQMRSDTFAQIVDFARAALAKAGASQ